MKQKTNENQYEHPTGTKKPIKQLCTLPAPSQKSVLKLISKEIPFPKVQLDNANLTHWNLCYLLL